MFSQSLSEVQTVKKQSSKCCFVQFAGFYNANAPSVADLKLLMYDMETRDGKGGAIYLQDVNNFQSTDNNKMWGNNQELMSFEYLSPPFNILLNYY